MREYNSDHYIIGLDLGNDSSGIAFFNLAENAPESIDLSGGYGKQTMPTVVQYIPGTREWVFGEYAVLNQGEGITYANLIARLGYFEEKTASVLALFIKEILGNVRNINPRAEIVGIVASIPTYFNAEAKKELTHAFDLAGFGNTLLALVPDRECVLAHYFYANESAGGTLLLDFGASEVRGGVYQRDSDTIHAVSSVFTGDVCMNKINSAVTDFFAELAPGLDKNQTEHIAAFAHQHRDMLFQKNIRTKPLKFYFNFTHPPVQATVTNTQVQEFLQPYQKAFGKFLEDTLQKSTQPISMSDIGHVLCTGGGFEMLWARDAVSKMFGSVQFYKNPKMVSCEGAAIVAARLLGLPVGKSLAIKDPHQLNYDVGLLDGKNFLPLVERSSFWWQEHPVKLVLVNHAVDGELELSFCKDKSNVGTMLLTGLPKRPKGTTRLQISVAFSSINKAIITIQDIGFGELFPSSGINLSHEVLI